MSSITAGCIVKTDFVTAGSKLFAGYIDYIDRETAVRSENLSKYSLYTNYMDNPEKTTELFTNDSDRLSNTEKQQLKALYEKAQWNGSPMWQTVISFDNLWLEKNRMYNSEEGFLDVRSLHEYTRKAVNAMLKKEGLDTAVWSAAIHYNTDNLHVHIATVEPTPTRPLITVKNVQFSAQWIRENHIIQDEKVPLNKRVAAHRSNNYGYRSICNRLKSTLEQEGYNTRFLGDYISVNANGTIDLSFNGKNDNLPYHSTLIYEQPEYKGKFKQSSINACRSTMVNSIIDNKKTRDRINEVIRNQFAATIRNDFLLENRDIIKQYFKVYDNLPPNKSDWQYGNNKYIARLRPEIDQITKMYLERYKADDFYKLKELIEQNDSLYREAYGKNSESNYIKNTYNYLFNKCGNAILTSMKNMAFRDIEEYRSESYIAAEVNEAAVTNEKIDFDGIINNHSSAEKDSDNDSKYWTDGFKEAKKLIHEGILSKSDNFDIFADSLFAEALDILNAEADNGNDLAAFELGKYYAQGTLGKIDNALAQVYYQRAFQGFTTELESDEWLQHFIAREEFTLMKSSMPKDKYERQMKKFDSQIEKDYWLENYLCYKIGRMYLNGSGVEKSIEKGIEYLEMSDSPFASYTIGSLYYRGEEVEQNFETAYDYFNKSCNTEGQMPIPFALYNMAEMIEKNLIADSIYNADDLYRMAFDEFVATDKNDPNDMIEYRIAKMLLDGKGTEPNQDEAEQYLRLSSLKGNTFAQTRLASLYLESGDAEKAELAMSLLESAANNDNDNDNAMYQYAKLLLDSTSADYDQEKGMQYLRMAVEKDNPFAQFKMGKILLDESLLYYNVKEGIQLLEKSAEQYNQFAQYSLGILYLRGEQIEQNMNLAIQYLSDSAEQGNQYALYTLGKIYIEDSDIQNIEKAIRYFTNASEQGNPFAAYTLGKIYSDENLTAPDEETSYKWYSVAYEGFTEIAQDEGSEPNDTVLYNLGIMSYSGLGVEVNLRKAVEYLTESADLENMFAQYQLGRIYLEDNEVHDIDNAVLYLSKAAEQGNPFAAYTLGKIYSDENLTAPDEEAAFKWYSVAYEGFTEIAQDEGSEPNDAILYNLGIMRYKGLGVEFDIHSAVKYLSESADLENVFAQYQLGRIYLEDNEVQNIDNAVFYLSKAAEQGNPFAAYTLGKIYSDKEMIIKDEIQADKWFRQAYKGFLEIEKDNGIETDGTVLYNLGTMNLNGLGTEKNLEKAIDYLLKSAHQNNEYAQYTLGKMYLKGEEVKQNIEYASLWLNASADQGNQFAQYQLGCIYYREEYGMKDIYKSISYLEQSADQGNQFAQYQLGIIYLKGDDAEQNFSLAYDYLYQAAEQDNQFAQYQLGMIFLKGKFTNIDYDKAISYLKQSAEQNNQFAQYQLGKLYYFGADGVEVNKDLALDYLNKSAAQGNEYAKALLEWKPNGSYMHFRHGQGFSERMVSLSSDMKMLFDRLANEHDHMLNQMVYNRLEKEKAKGETIEQ